VSAHTKGAWSVTRVASLNFRAPADGDYYIAAPDETCVAIIWQYGQQGAANAHLIAAAPRLLAALADCANRLERCCIHSGSDKEFAAHAVEDYRALISTASSGKP
jgi:hypothetical protein